MKWLACLLFSCSLHALSIVFVHVGPWPLPEHLPVVIEQAHLFNPDCPIYLIAYRKAMHESSTIPSYVKRVSCESLVMSEEHHAFRASGKHDRGGNGFWIWTSERFFFLDSFLSAYRLTDVFHLENDVMLYTNLAEMLPLFHKHYPGMIAATFERDNRCVPGFFYIANGEPMGKLIKLIPTAIMGDANSDMETIARFKDLYQGVWIDFLPILMPEYLNEEHRSLYEKNAKNPRQYCNHFEEFQSVFDAAAIGVYFGGWNAQFHEEHEPGEIDPHCLFNASHFTYEWEKDALGRKIPFLLYEGKKVRINNLHITNKQRLPLFSSM